MFVQYFEICVALRCLAFRSVVNHEAHWARICGLTEHGNKYKLLRSTILHLKMVLEQNGRRDADVLHLQDDW